MPLSPAAVLHYQRKCDPETCVLCKAERDEGTEPPEAHPMKKVGIVDFLGVAVPVWSFGHGRLFTGMDLAPETIKTCQHPVYSAKTMEELQATVEVAMALARKEPSSETK